MPAQETHSSTISSSCSSTSARSKPKSACRNPEILVSRIRVGDPAALAELYEIFHASIRILIGQKLGWQDVDDRVHDLFVLVVKDIQRGVLRQPSCLSGYIRTIVKRQIAAHIDAACKARERQVDYCELGLADSAANPEQQFARAERTGLMRTVLACLSPRERGVLFRFYVLGQTADQIESEMHLSPPQFRLLKWRAKARFGDLGRRRLRRHL